MILISPEIYLAACGGVHYLQPVDLLDALTRHALQVSAMFDLRDRIMTPTDLAEIQQAAAEIRIEGER